MGKVISKRSLAVLVSALLALIIVTAALFWRGLGYITYPAKPEVLQTERAVQLKDAQKCPISLPSTAKDIYYASYSQFSVSQIFVRFEVPYEDAVLHAQRLFREYAARDGRVTEVSDPRPIIEPPELRIEPLPELHVGWFDIEHIHNGVTFGDINVGGPRIWIDKDRNLFFYCLTD